MVTLFVLYSASNNDERRTLKSFVSYLIDPWQGQETFSCPKHPDWLLGPTQPPVQGVLGFFPGIKAARA